ncbi:hypothetical protein [Lewinella sp. W8]|uniref:hypothetical protein n=1 Tax=Lewinella sp. W8 TaxID=2528208 RepID=UPI001067E0BA|nr:hypothetical protein [Lewinella sp. W8]MTB50148.1 hypothetical protein [Lewinella sp. W8]
MKNKHLLILGVVTLGVFFLALYMGYVGQSIMHAGEAGPTTIFGLNRNWLGAALIPALSGTLFPLLFFFFYLWPRMRAEE